MSARTNEPVSFGTERDLNISQSQLTDDDQIEPASKGSSSLEEELPLISPPSPDAAKPVSTTDKTMTLPDFPDAIAGKKAK